MHLNRTGRGAVEHDDQELVLTNYGAGYAWLRPDDQLDLTDLGRRALAESRLFDPAPTVAEPDARGRWDGTWNTYVFQAVTTFRLIAPNAQKALEWFDDAKADIELVDCDAMRFDNPTLVATQTADGQPVDVVAQRPQREAGQASPLQRFAARWHFATRPVAFCGAWRRHAEGGRSC